MKIRAKLVLGISVLPIIIFLSIGISWFQLLDFSKMSGTLKANYELSTITEQINIGVKNEAISIRNLVILNDRESLLKEMENIQTENDSVSQNIALLETKVTTKKERDLVKDLKNANKELNVYKGTIVKLLTEGKKEEAIHLIYSNGHSIQDQFFKLISNITDNFKTNTNSSFSTFLQDFQKKIIIGGLISLISFIIIISFVSRGVWTVAARLKNVSSVMSSVADGTAELNTKVEVRSNDEIDEVALSFNRMVESLEEQIKKERSLIWSKSNIAEITTSLTGRLDMESLARTFLSKIVPLLEACHAVFYVKNSDKQNKPIFQLVASYAFKERKHFTNSFRVGEGLVGQAVLEKSPIILTDVPSDYIRVKSGLGEGSPFTLYVLPVSFDGDVKAVLELASFKPFTVSQQTFLEEVIDGLGIILDSAMGRIQLAKLLEESQSLTEEVQAQAEELQSQQDELKATNEELEEQTQALRHSEEKLQVQQEELEQTNAELKEKADSLEEQNKKNESNVRKLERAREELEEKAQQLSLSSKYKSEFLANMSHELRTPLNSLLILSKLLSDNHDGNLSEKQVEYSKTIYSAGNDLLILINDILDLTKIESGKMELNLSKVFINDLIEYVENRFKPIANEKNVRFKIVVKDGIPGFIYSDEQRIQQVLKNLLSNAFKFTDKGEVTIVIDLFSKNNRQTVLSFSVEDTGIGIPKEKQELIFQAFQQADGTTSRKYGGTGLGLSICREISALLGGKIVVESEEGKGSVFTFYVGDYREAGRDIDHFIQMNEAAVTLEHKLEAPASQLEQNKLIETNNHIKKLLIVDDDMKQRNSLMELIGDRDVIIKAVSSGNEAMEQFKVSHFDCLILDLGLTDTSGFDLLENIKSHIENQNLKVFVYTGRDLSSKEEIYLNKYADAVIIKNEHSPQRLIDELELYLNSSNGKMGVLDQTVGDKRKKVPGLEGKKVLIVDDDVRNVYALSSILEINGMKISFAENGVEGLELLEKYPDFDIVLMDIMMPEMDGYEAMQKIRAMPIFGNLPIIALTAKAMKEDREKCMEAGASDYIVKPVDPDQLISLLRVWLYPHKGNL